MKQIFRIFTLIAVAMLTAEQAWAGSAADLGFIKRGTVTGGSLRFYKEAACQNEIYPNSNLYSSDLTDGKVYIKATPDWNYTAVEVTITAQVSTSSSPAQARTITRGSTSTPGVAVGDFIDVTATDTKGVYQITMPADGKNVTVSATFKEKPYLGDGTNAHISYYSYDAQGNRVTSNTGDDGHPRVYILDGTEEVLGEGNENPTWYVCNTTDLSYTSTLRLNGDVHLILADNAKMTMDVNAPAILGSGNFYIYGQSDGDNIGKLIATSSDGTGITINGNLYINGGQVEATGTNTAGIAARYDVTIRGGQVEASCTDGHGIVAINNVTISGGQVTATGSDTNYGIYTPDIILGWTNASDYIKASSYNVSAQGTVKTAAGQRFVAYTPGATESDPMIATAIISGTVARENGSYPIDGQKLKPLDGYTVTVADGISVGTLSGTTFTAADPDFTITTGAGTESGVTTPYYIYKASTQEAPVTVTLSYSGTNFIKLGGLPEGTTLDAVANQPLQRSFAMPAEDLALTATAVTSFSVSGYYTYSGSAQTPSIKYGDNVIMNADDDFIVTGITKGGTTVTDAIDAGDYSLTIAGVGSYMGTASGIAFSINKKPVYNNSSTITEASSFPK